MKNSGKGPLFFTFFYAAYVAAFCVIAGSCAPPQSSQTGFVLGTFCTIQLYEQGRPELYKKIFDRLREIENRMSVNIEGTDIDRVNKAAGIEAVKVHEDVFEVVERALYYAELSGGAFDPTVGPLVSLWGIGGDGARVPLPEEIAAVLPLINRRDVEMDRENRTIFLKKKGMVLDLGAIAKGYAADEAALLVKKAGVKRAIIDLGGNILVCGKKRDGSPWSVGIQDPFDERGAYIGIVETGEKSVVTSGIYERFFEADGERYHHILFPGSGYPAENGLLSVTIISGVSMSADALSTAVFVLGYEKGRALIDSLEDVEGIFVFEDRSVRTSNGAGFTLSGENYRMVFD